MDRLTCAAAVADWIARLSGPIVLWVLGVAATVAAIRIFPDSGGLSVAVGGIGAAAVAVALHLTVRAVRRLRSGPVSPPGEGF